MRKMIPFLAIMVTIGTVAFLLQAGYIGPRSAPSPEVQMLLTAARRGDLAGVEKALADGADINEHLRFQGGSTQPTRVAWSFGGGDGSPGNTLYALANVAGTGRTAIVEAMLKAGAEVAGQPRGGDALVAAARGDHVEVLRSLIDAGADMNYKNRSGDTPLGAAVEAGAREAIAFLEQRGVREW